MSHQAKCIFLYVGYMCLYVRRASFYRNCESPAAVLFDQRFDQEPFSSALHWFRNVSLKCCALLYFYMWDDLKFALSAAEFVEKQEQHMKTLIPVILYITALKLMLYFQRNTEFYVWLG